jgi:chromosome partitioning protein
LDPQGNATSGAGINKLTLNNSIYETLIGKESINDVVIASEDNMFNIAPANQSLAGAEIEMVNIDHREYILKKAFKTLKKNIRLHIN